LGYETPVDPVSQNAIGILNGLIIVIPLRFCVGKILNHVTKEINKLPDPLSELEITKEKWKQFMKGSDYPGAWLGHLERVLFFVAMWFGLWQVVAGWLAFKLASKWETYKGTVSLPQKLDDINDLDYLLSRRRLGSERTMRLLIGTLLNVLIPPLGVGIGRLVLPAIAG
jgi:hypothetical protein